MDIEKHLNTVIVGDALKILKTFPDRSVQMCVTSKSSVNRSNSGKSGTKISGKGHPSSQVRENHDIRNGPTSVSKTIGWDPSCLCDSPSVPCIVLDPFMGAGTSGLVAAQHRRSFIGIELNPEYAKMATRRIAPELAQGKMF